MEDRDDPIPQEAVVLMAPPTEVNVLLAFVPRVVIAVRQTTTIRASMTAYSTAVGPSSRFKKSTTKLPSLRMCLLLLKHRVPDEQTRTNSAEANPPPEVN